MKLPGRRRGYVSMAERAADFVADHPELVERAAAERIDPTLLIPVTYAPAFTMDAPRLDPSPPCRDCGHPRWAHAVPGIYWDGGCICGCDCPSGYLPGKVADGPDAEVPALVASSGPARPSCPACLQAVTLRTWPHPAGGLQSLIVCPSCGWEGHSLAR